MTPKQSAALALAERLASFADSVRPTPTATSWEPTFRPVLDALDAYRTAPDAPDLERAVLDAAGTAAAMLRHGVDLQPTGPTGIALVEAVDALLAAKRADAPDLSAVEREYLEACYEDGVGSSASGYSARACDAYRALHAARTRREPDALEEILDRPWRELSKQDKHRVREILREQDQALAERTRRG